MSRKKTLIDYRELSLATLHEPRYAHVKLLWGWVGYFLLYLLTENLIPAERCHPVHIWLDDLIPFCEYFAVFYVGWYFLVFFSLAYYFFTDTENFKRLQIYIIVTQVVAMAVYILLPSRQDLRPEEFARSNVFTQVMAFLYSLDTSTGVCPSLHVAYSLGILSVYLRDKTVTWPWKLFLIFFVTGVCLSVCFVKQHSALDVLAALPVCALAEWVVFGKHPWKKAGRT